MRGVHGRPSLCRAAATRRPPPPPPPPRLRRTLLFSAACATLPVGKPSKPAEAAACPADAQSVPGFAFATPSGWQESRKARGIAGVWSDPTDDAANMSISVVVVASPPFASAEAAGEAILARARIADPDAQLASPPRTAAGGAFVVRVQSGDFAYTTAVIMSADKKRAAVLNIQLPSTADATCAEGVVVDALSAL